MPRPFNSFIWYDVASTDVPATKKFYCDVFGWSAKKFAQNLITNSENQAEPLSSPISTDNKADDDYTVFSVGSVAVAGLINLPDRLKVIGVKPHWTGYISVDNVDAYTANIKFAGGSILRGPSTAPDVGRFAVVADPHGAIFIILEPDPKEDPPETILGRHGPMGWHELMAGDGELDFTFYAQLFGWTKAETLDLGERGKYQFFSIGGTSIGGIMTKPAEVRKPFWLFYMNVDDVDDTVLRVKKSGGHVLLEPIQVPTGKWISQATDNCGALFAFTGQRT